MAGFGCVLELSGVGLNAAPSRERENSLMYRPIVVEKDYGY